MLPVSSQSHSEGNLSFPEMEDYERLFLQQSPSEAHFSGIPSTGHSSTGVFSLDRNTDRDERC